MGKGKERHLVAERGNVSTPVNVGIMGGTISGEKLSHLLVGKLGRGGNKVVIG